MGKYEELYELVDESEEVLIDLEEYNNFEEATSAQLQNLLQKGKSIYNRAINNSASKQKKHLKQMNNLVNNRWENLQNVDATLDKKAREMEHYDDSYRKEKIREAEGKFANQLLQKAEEKRIAKDILDSELRRATSAEEKHAANIKYKNTIGRIDDEISRLNKEKALTIGANKSKRTAKKEWENERRRVLNPLKQKVASAQSAYNKVKGKNNVDYGALNDKKVAKTSNGLSEYEMRAIKRGYKAQQAQSENDRYNAMKKKADAMGLGKKMDKNKLSLKEYYKIKYGDRLNEFRAKKAQQAQARQQQVQQQQS